MSKDLAIITVFNIVAVVFYCFPPKKINHLYGYRTIAAMSSPETFIMANKYASRCLLLAAIINTILVLLLLLANLLFYPFSVFTTLAALVITIVSTEKKISKYRSEHPQNNQ
ncbi:SdpI family protein [Filimonas effusa]|nr:SdpI family protein [Filimonas effusa]